MVFCQFSRCDSVRDIFYAVLRHFGQQGWGHRKGFRFRMPIRLLDLTLVSLTMSVYEWAHYTATKGSVKMHTLLDYDSLLPGFVCITDGKEGNNRAAFGIAVKPHTIIVADRGC